MVTFHLDHITEEYIHKYSCIHTFMLQLGLTCSSGIEGYFQRNNGGMIVFTTWSCILLVWIFLCLNLLDWTLSSR